MVVRSWLKTEVLKSESRWRRYIWRQWTRTCCLPQNKLSRCYDSRSLQGHLRISLTILCKPCMILRIALNHTTWYLWRGERHHWGHVWWWVWKSLKFLNPYKKMSKINGIPRCEIPGRHCKPLNNFMGVVHNTIREWNFEEWRYLPFEGNWYRESSRGSSLTAEATEVGCPRLIFLYRKR